MEVDQVRRRPYPHWFMRFALRRALKKPSPDRIPLGPISRLADRDYATTYIDGATGSKYWLVDGMKGAQLELRDLETPGKPENGIADLKNVARANFRVVVYFKHLEWHFQSLYRYAFFSVFGMVRVRVALDNFLQAIANRASLPTIERTKALQAAVDRAWSGQSSLYLAEVVPIQGRRLRHPGLESAFHGHKMVLDSLVETGELRCELAGVYEITPKALVTLDQYKIEERRIRAQGRAAFWTALIAAIVGAVISSLKS